MESAACLDQVCHPERSEVRTQSKDSPTRQSYRRWKVLRLSLADSLPLRMTEKKKPRA